MAHPVHKLCGGDGVRSSCLPPFLVLVTHNALHVSLHRRDILKKCKLTALLGDPISNGSLLPYGTNNIVMLSPNKYECGIACLVTGFGMSLEQLGIDPDEHLSVWPPVTYTFRRLNQILAESTGAGRAVLLKSCDLMTAGEAFLQTSGIYMIHCRWIHPDNREASATEFDWDSNYEHCESALTLTTLLPSGLQTQPLATLFADVVWNADRGYLYACPNIVIPWPGELDDLPTWFCTLMEKEGLHFAPSGCRRVRKLVIMPHHKRAQRTAFFGPFGPF